MADELQVVDFAMLAIGGAIGLGCLILAVRSWRRRGSLRDIPNATPNLSLMHVAAGLIVFLCSALATQLMTARRQSVPPPASAASQAADPTGPGTDAWFRSNYLAQLGGQVCSAAFGFLLLARMRLPARRAAAGDIPHAEAPISPDESKTGTSGSRAFRAGLRGIAVGIPAGLALTPVVVAIVAVWVAAQRALVSLEPMKEHVILNALRDNAWGATGTWLLASSAIVSAPLWEEMMYRGLFIPALRNLTGSPWMAIMISGTLFGVMHYTIPHSVVPLAFMGVALGYVRVRFDSVAACVVAHSLFNARTIVFALLAPELLTE